MLGAGGNMPSYIPGLKGHAKREVVLLCNSLWFQGAHAQSPRPLEVRHGCQAIAGSFL